MAKTKRIFNLVLTDRVEAKWHDSGTVEREHYEEVAPGTGKVSFFPDEGAFSYLGTQNEKGLLNKVVKAYEEAGFDGNAAGGEEGFNEAIKTLSV